MARARKACSYPHCPELQPCPVHARKAWEGSTRRTRVGSGSMQQKMAAFVMHRDDGVCHVCGQPDADEADHVVPLAEGGEHHVDNMKPIHSTPCHRDKTAQEAARARNR